MDYYSRTDFKSGIDPVYEQRRLENPKKATKGWVYIIAGLIACAVLLAMIIPQSPPSPKPPPKTPAEIRKDLVSSQFSTWDGSHPALTKLIKESMHNPESYEHVKTFYWDDGDHITVKTTYRGTNLFNAVVTNWVKAKVDTNGNVIEITAQGP